MDQAGALRDRADAEASDDQSREEMRAFLQKRVAIFGLILALMWGLLFAWRILSTLSEDDSPSSSRSSVKEAWERCTA